MLIRTLKVILTYGSLLSFQHCQSQDKDATFQLDGSASLTIKNETVQPLNIEIENWHTLPLASQKIDTLVLANASIQLRLISQGKSYFDLKIGEKKYKIFSQPDANNQLSVTKKEILFNGDLRAINQFTANKVIDFNSLDSDWLPRVNTTHGNGSFAELISVNDSITKLHQTYLFKNRNELPNWYVEFESKRLKYLNAHWKLNSLMYRKRMMKKRDAVPANFLESTINSLAINDESMLGNSRYMNFLSDYIGYTSDPNYEKEMPSSLAQWDQFYQAYFDSVNKQLVGEVRDVYLAFTLGNLLENRKHLFKNEWTDQINNQRLRNYVHGIANANPILPNGTNIPYFYLQDSSGLNYKPSDFEGKVLLINFWATWCRPCIQEFPHENKLVKRFENRPVEIVNICIDSDVIKWKKLIAKHQLKTTNLFAEGNWNSNLQEKFGIQALPHSILIDEKGQVVQNKCPRASGNVEDLIMQLLGED